MKKLNYKFRNLIILALCSTAFTVNAQTPVSECYTSMTPSPLIPVSTAIALPCVPSTAPTTDFNSFYIHKENYKPIDGVVAPLYVHKTIKILFHVMQPSTSGGTRVNYEDNPTDVAVLNAIVNQMNTWLANVPTPSAPRTAVCGTCHITDSRFRVAMAKKADGSNDIRYHPEGLTFEQVYASSGAGPATYTGRLNDFFDNPEGVLNVFLMYTSYPLGPLGGVSLGYNGTVSHIIDGVNNGIPFIVAENYYRTSSINLVANNLLHEIGHTMATHHTFAYVGGGSDETCSETDLDYLSDAFGTAVTTKKCPLSLGIEDVFMNYNTSGNYMTPLQIARWHRNAHFMSCRKYIYNTYPEDKNHDHTGQGQLNPYLITKNETWDFDIKMYTDIVVKSGKKLTIKCRILMPYHANIIVEPGAELEIDGGIISSHHDTTMWYGISVWGNASKSQNVTSDQGLLTMKNGATISNALHAVMLADAVYGLASRNGGIARIDDAHFINNRRSIGFHDYHNLNWEFKGGTWTRTWLQANKSYINKSTFTVDNNMIRDPRGQVTLSGVEGVSIRGCSFTATMPYTASGIRCTSSCPDQNAIATWNASFVLDKWAPLSGTAGISPSYISGYRHGVLASSFAVSNNFRVMNTTFEKNLIGVATRAVNNFTVKGNNFLIENPVSLGVAALGMQLNSSSLYQVYNNTFNRTSPYGFRIGIEVSEGGRDYNKVNNNVFSDLTIGSQSSFQNTNEHYIATDPEILSQGLEFTCNTYNFNGVGIYIQGYKDPSTGITHDGVRRIQGSAAVPAGNTFLGYGIEAQNRTYPPPTILYTHPLDKYYYYTLAATQNPSVSVNVFKTGTPNENLCVVPESSSTVSGTTGGSSSSAAATAARASLAAAYDDYSTDRPTILNNALLAMESPYAEVERSLLHMQQGDVTQGLAIYNAIVGTMQLTAQEHNDFVQGGTLMRIIASRYALSNTPRWDSLSNTDLDSIRYVRDHSRMWAHQRACAWLGYAKDEHCTTLIPEIPEGINANNQRRAQEGIDINEAAYLHIKPNPSMEYFDISYVLDGAQDASLMVSDATGRTILQSTLPVLQKTYRINAKDWASGVYLYQVSQNGKNLYHGKLIKQ